MQFSIIIPVYNVSPYLRACLDSVLGQTDSGWEAICVDDGSTDESGAILDEYAAKNSRIRVLHKKNGGEGSARNAGLEQVKGEWFLFLDADDLLALDAIENVRRCAAVAQNADMIRYRAVSFADGGSPVWGDQTMREPVTYDVATALPNRDVHGTCWLYAYRQSVFGAVRFGDYFMGADRVFLVSCLVKAKTIVEHFGACYGYREREGSIMHRKMTSRHVTDTIRFIVACLRILKGSGKSVSKAACREFGSLWAEWSLWTCYHFDRDECAQTWRFWKDSLEDVAEVSMYFNSWRRLTFEVCRLVPIWPVAYVLCVLPYRLKLAGLHR